MVPAADKRPGEMINNSPSTYSDICSVSATQLLGRTIYTELVGRKDKLLRGDCGFFVLP